MVDVRHIRTCFATSPIITRPVPVSYVLIPPRFFSGAEACGLRGKSRPPTRSDPIGSGSRAALRPTEMRRPHTEYRASSFSCLPPRIVKRARTFLRRALEVCSGPPSYPSSFAYKSSERAGAYERPVSPPNERAPPALSGQQRWHNARSVLSPTSRQHPDAPPRLGPQSRASDVVNFFFTAPHPPNNLRVREAGTRPLPNPR